MTKPTEQKENTCPSCRRTMDGGQCWRIFCPGTTRAPAPPVDDVEAAANYKPVDLRFADKVVASSRHQISSDMAFNLLKEVKHSRIIIAALQSDRAIMADLVKALGETSTALHGFIELLGSKTKNGFYRFKLMPSYEDGQKAMEINNSNKALLTAAQEHMGR